jgi:hypothetical protein
LWKAYFCVNVIQILKNRQKIVIWGKYTVYMETSPMFQKATFN